MEIRNVALDVRFGDAADLTLAEVWNKMIFGNPITMTVAAVICLTLICTVILSQLIGGLLPVIAEKLNFDPAVMASPLITTIVDTTTLLVYFNIARVLLKI